MRIRTYTKKTQITKHFNSDEFRCPHCHKSSISLELLDKLEEIYRKVNASKCIISSGYRCSYYDKKQNGFAGWHSKSLACDCIFYDKNNKVIPSKVIICIAYELKIPGIAYINSNYTHLDMRTSGTYRGDESRGNSSYWTNPYTYFKITKQQVANYTTSNDITYQVYSGKWYKSVKIATNDYAGVFGKAITRVYIDKLRYRVKVDNKWLPEVVGRNDYAGYSSNRAINAIAIKNKTYRVHVKGGSWLPWVNSYNINDSKNGYAGNNKIIDAIQIK